MTPSYEELTRRIDLRRAGQDALAPLVDVVPAPSLTPAKEQA